jgi:sortase A
MKIYKIFTGLLVIIFVGVVGFFIVYPSIPKIVEIKNVLMDLSPYNIGFQVTTQIFVELTEPEYLEEDTNSTIEFVPENIEVADLESKNTKVEIPAISVKGSVVDGISQERMLDGFWHHPVSSTPGSRGNIVIFGHRFDKIPPSPETFFNLDKVEVGDKIYIKQADREYEYTVVKTYETEKNDQDIFKNFTDYQLTLVTCAPLWSSERRLVVVAVQDWVSSVI